MRSNSPLVTLVATAALACAASAQTITWGPVLPTFAPTDVNTNGVLVVARNLHGVGATQSPAINGVTFVGAFAPSGWTNAATNVALNGSTTGDAAYDLLLASNRATSGTPGNPGGWGGIRLDTLGTLTVGHTYEIQCWYTDQRLGGAVGTANEAGYDRQTTLSSAVGGATLTGGEVNNLGALVQGPASGPLDGDPDNQPALGGPDVLFGSHCTGTFTWVNASDQLWLLAQFTHPIPTAVQRPSLTAFQIRDVSAAAFSTSGVGCPSTVGLSLLSAPSLPVLGGTLQVTMNNVSPLGVPLMILGVATVPPFPISLIGLTTDPTCLLTVDLLELVGPLPTAGGSATMSLAIPSVGTLAGLSLYVQGTQLELSGWSITEQGRAVLGY